MLLDRDYYRSLSTESLLAKAREDGLTPEMAIAITERLAQSHNRASTLGHYHFQKGAIHEL